MQWWTRQLDDVVGNTLNGQLSLALTSKQHYMQIVGDLPNLSTVYVWDKAANTYVSSTKGRAGFSPNPALANGDAM